VKRPQKLTKCSKCDNGCRADWMETSNGIVFINPLCTLHKPGFSQRRVTYTRRYEAAHGINERLYSFTDKEGNMVFCKKAYWYRTRKQGRHAEPTLRPAVSSS